MILLIDNYDSFVYTLKRYVEEAGRPCQVVRNDAVTVAEVLSAAPEAVIISPGPGRPENAGVSTDLVKTVDAPLLGVCLGHQCIAEAFGGAVGPARTPMHGRASPIEHDGRGVLADLPNPFEAGRYHSLSVRLVEDGPLEATAWAPDGDIMALRHKTTPIHGVQFHPESVLTGAGRRIVENFLNLAKRGAS